LRTREKKKFLNFKKKGGGDAGGKGEGGSKNRPLPDKQGKHRGAGGDKKREK